MCALKVAVVCGTRPEIIKMAPVFLALKEDPAFEPVLLHSGQHTEMATPLYKLFDIEPVCCGPLDRGKGSLAELSATLLNRLSAQMTDIKPDVVLVHGDTTTAAMAALAAFYQKIPVGHVEAGLRTGDKYSPFPEEMNRSLIGRIAQWHFAPTSTAEYALRREGIALTDILTTGNTVIDAALWTRAKLQGTAPAGLEQAQAHVANGGKLVLVTAHRRENWGEGICNIARSVAQIVQQYPDVMVVWPVHGNPAVAMDVRATLDAHVPDFAKDRVLRTTAMDYAPLIWVLSKSWATLTDSGGIQEEAAALGVPVLVLRDSTERPELIEAGGGVICGAVSENILAVFVKLHANEDMHQKMREVVNPFGDGNAAVQIRNFLKSTLKL